MRGIVRTVTRLCFITILASFLAGCSRRAPHSDTGSAASRQPTLPLLLLPQGQHLGYIEGFNPDNPPALRETMDAAFREALQNGMKVARVQMDWPEVESTPGKFDQEKLVDRLRFAHDKGLAIYLLVCTADTDGLNYPKDLLAEGGKRLARNMKPDDPVIVTRYSKMLDWLIPLARKNGVYCISVGNEPDTHHKDDPTFMRHFIKFVAAVRDHAHTIDPDIAITYTSTCDPVLQSDRAYAKDIADSVDVFCFNLYAFGNRDGLDLKTTEQVLAGMIALSKGKPIQIQELGCSSLLNPSPDWQFHKSSPELQRQFFVWAFSRIRETQQIRAAYVFQLVENSPRIDKFYSDAFGAGMPKDWTRNLCDWMKGLGLIRFDTGEKKPAWNEFLNELKRK
jgi:hypothetical protein